MKYIKQGKQKNGQLYEIWHRLKKNRVALFGMSLLIFFVAVAICADLIVPYEVAIKQTTDLLEAPSSAHLFGTDKLGRDVFARVIHATRASLLIGVASCLISLVIGGVLGSAAGYYGGKVDEIIMRIMDMFMCIPTTLLALAIVAALGTSMTNLMIALIISSVPNEVRLIRSVILKVVGADFVKAARSYGARDPRIIAKYILPSAIGPIIVNTTMNISGKILAAASLSYIGMGVQPPTPEWGYMLSEASEYMRRAPHLLIFPGLAILLAALSFNLLGDGLQDALDPRLKD